jgi:tetratricopeptide (TPR) repeat protein
MTQDDYNGEPMIHLLTKRPAIMRTALLSLCLLSLFCNPAMAQDSEKKATDMARGDYFFKAGYYLKASESYRVAILDRPRDTERLLSFANALFALGNYHYSSHAIRRAVKHSSKKSGFDPQVAPMFPHRLSYVRALDDLKRYVTYNRRDPSALTVLAYTYYADGEFKKSRKICGYLKLLDREDPLVAFMNKLLKASMGSKKAPKAKTKSYDLKPLKLDPKPIKSPAKLPALPDTKPLPEKSKLAKTKPMAAVSE